jgi:Phage related hypothetical protein (DUF1799)
VGAALYSPGPTAAEAKAFGLTVDEASGPPVEVWPDNLAPVNIFIAMATQWRLGPGGPIGLDYAALPAVMRLCGIPKKERAEAFDGIRILEDAALEQMRAKQ